MKKTILCLLFTPIAISAQNFDSNNEPAMGTLATLHLCDSNASDYAGIVGNNVTWDYSQLAGIYGVTKDVEIQDATGNSNYSSFAGSTKVLSIGGTLETFYNSSTSNRISQGFVFNEVSLGSVIASWSNDPQILMNYPFAYSNQVSDNFDGTITTTATGTVASTGTSMCVYDGLGTLLLPGANTYTNVTRYHIKDSATAVVFGNTVNVIRNVFEYYDFTISNLPIFIKLNVSLNSPLFNNASSMVLSKDLPTTFVGFCDYPLYALSLYPNPTSDKIIISGVPTNSSFSIFNPMGKLILDGSYTDGIELNNVESGVYFITINNQTLSFVKK